MSIGTVQWVRLCFGKSGICDHPQTLPTVERWAKLEAATRFLSTTVGGSLIPIVVYRDGDGFSQQNTFIKSTQGLPICKG